MMITTPIKGQTVDGDRVDRRRHRRIRWFFWKLTLHILWWDIVLNRYGLRAFRTPYTTRWQCLACEFRSLALEVGGLLIKLGQFLSTRVDLARPGAAGCFGGHSSPH
jgi:predicted unusual protein kinase regulating ubiquinone biosynthesis (AarF/ABC1/UbiB family)